MDGKFFLSGRERDGWRMGAHARTYIHKDFIIIRIKFRSS